MTGDELRARCTRALADAEIEDDVVSEALADALEIDVDGDAVTVTVTLPIPSSGIRAAVEREIVETLRGVDGISRIECRFEVSIPDPGPHVDVLPGVKHVVAVASGKGGVGKSTVAVNLAAALADAGADVGLLDADVYGPNAPAMLGLGESTPETTLEDQIVPREVHGVRVMSMEFLVGEDDPVIWRGPVVDEFVQQLFGDVQWGELDYLIVDLPPGTGDVQLSLVQYLPVTGAVVVTTPQQVAVDDARRGLEGLARYDVPILGIVENMAGFECPDCGSSHDLFGSGGASDLAEDVDAPVIGRLPVDPEVGQLQDGADDSEPPGVSIPMIGRLQLPRTREERERPGRLPPVTLREEGGAVRDAIERVATRTAARVSSSAVERD